jgi:uncharacterized protein YbaP (TraB family)
MGVTRKVSLPRLRRRGRRRGGARALAAAVIVLGFGLTTARPAAAACPPQIGTDAELLAAGDIRAAISAANLSLANASGKLWKIEAGDAPPSTLVGTFHLPIGGAEVPPPAVEAAVRAARLLLVEITRTDMEAEMKAAMVADPGLVMQFDGSPLSALLSPAEKRLADEALSGLGLSLAVVDRFRPWAVFLMTALPPCVMLELATTQKPGLDERIVALAEAEGVEVRSLETFLEIVEHLEPDTPERTRRMLVATVGMAKDAEKRLHDTRALYSAADIGAIWELAKADLAAVGVLEAPDEAMAEFWEMLVAGRNVMMVERAAPELARGGVVMAVGALHLPGEDGIIEMLRGRGFTVTRLD